MIQVNNVLCIYTCVDYSALLVFYISETKTVQYYAQLLVPQLVYDADYENTSSTAYKTLAAEVKLKVSVYKLKLANLPSE